MNGTGRGSGQCQDWERGGSCNQLVCLVAGGIFAAGRRLLPLCLLSLPIYPQDPELTVLPRVGVCTCSCCFVLQVKLAISYALAQSTKLSLHERRVTDMVMETKHLPESLAATGKVALSPETIAKLIGKVGVLLLLPLLLLIVILTAVASFTTCRCFFYYLP